MAQHQRSATTPISTQTSHGSSTHPAADHSYFTRAARSTPTAHDWVSETRFGKWFLSTNTWLNYVLTQAVADLKVLAAPHLPAAIDRLMDVGCGQGAAFVLLQQAFAPACILGVDVDPDMLSRAAGPARDSVCPVDLKHSSVTQLGLPDAVLDVVFCHQLVHHVADQHAALRELHRVLKPGGVLLLSESCAAFINSWPVRWLFRHPAGVQKDAEGYLDLLAATGFEFSASDARAYTPWWSLPDLGLLRRLGIRSTSDVATELMVVARKR